MKTYVFIAVGIGITPFRSIIQDLLDRKKSVPIVLFYQAKSEDEVLFREVFERAEKEISLQTIYIINDPLTKELLQKHIKDIGLRTYFVSGPQTLVENYRELLESLHVPFEQIKTDLFTGYESS